MNFVKLLKIFHLQMQNGYLSEIMCFMDGTIYIFAWFIENAINKIENG